MLTVPTLRVLPLSALSVPLAVTFKVAKEMLLVAHRVATPAEAPFSETEPVPRLLAAATLMVPAVMVVPPV